jgi:tetratricopeptide (TPR) repeat protein
MSRAPALPLALALFAAAAGMSGAFHRPLWPVFQRPVLEEFAVADAGFVASGLRRFGADLAFIQMLQYYAHEEEGREAGPGERAQHFHMGGEGTADLHPEVRLESFPRLREHVLRIGSLDPYFHYAFLFGAGALGFNLNRADEALEVLRAGAAADPEFWQYRLYAGAVAYRRSADLDKAAALLEEAMHHPDCPTLLQNILANIHLKRGDRRRAAEIFARIVETSRDEGYVLHAARKLQELGVR